MKKGDLCLVTGVSGYLGAWIAKDLLEKGFRVRGTVRDLMNAKRNDTLKKLLPGIELVAADLRRPEGWEQAVAGAQWIFHVASPQAVKTERDRTGGALSGTRLVLTAAFTEPSVRKVVVTSSEAAIAYGHPSTKRTINENDWTDLQTVGKSADYFRSKTLAEKLAWEMASDRAINPRGVPIATINPSLILGPSLVPWGIGRYSLGTLGDIAQGKMPLMVDMTMRVVDVRDCARMHIAVMADPSTNGHRHLSMGTTATFASLASSISKDFGHLGFKPPVRIMPSPIARILSLVSGDLRSIKSHIGTVLDYQTLSPEVYRYEYQDLGGIVRDSMNSMLANGWLAPAARDAGRVAA
ncbi:MAG: NAD-dependent epimerase/dehydratase family protein [Betaproteobacteria bacterium]|nr:NAD-dependent epimerase/dehydratase family protein [Betaproteobacteria bacterium]